MGSFHNATTVDAASPLARQRSAVDTLAQSVRPPPRGQTDMGPRDWPDDTETCGSVFVNTPWLVSWLAT